MLIIRNYNRCSVSKVIGICVKVGVISHEMAPAMEGFFISLRSVNKRSIGMQVALALVTTGVSGSAPRDIFYHFVMC